jgi:methyl-accepting chemotaxis protein
MIRQIPLKWKLTGSMLGIWGIIITTLIVVFNSTQSKLDIRFADLFREELKAKTLLVSNDLVFEVAAGQAESAVEKLKIYEATSTDIELVAVLDPSYTPLFLSNDRSDYKHLLKASKGVRSGESKIVGERLVAVQAIMPDTGKAVGYIVVIKSLQEYNSQRKALTTAILLMGILGTLVAAGSAYLIGYRIALPIHKLVSTAERIANGDLTKIDMESKGAQEMSRLAATIQLMAEAMRSQVMAIKNLTREISDISKETEGTMTNLASSAAEQAAAVNETAATVEEMERAGQSSAGNAKQIVVVAEKTAEASLRGRQTVEKTYEIIMQIKDDSQDISDKSKNLLNAVEEVGNIIQSVNSIAEQSKILAVNASIEAAKAGEFGSGFAVVAQEVKDLAQQSKDATLQITGTLTAIREAIEKMVATAQAGKERTAEGVNTIANAGAVMNDLSEAIRENSNFANAIASNIKQQTIGLTQIAAAIEEINTTALENQNISRSIVDGTKQMNQTFVRLTEMVGAWRTPDN